MEVLWGRRKPVQEMRPEPSLPLWVFAQSPLTTPLEVPPLVPITLASQMRKLRHGSAWATVRARAVEGGQAVPRPETHRATAVLEVEG